MISDPVGYNRINTNKEMVPLWYDSSILSPFLSNNHAIDHFGEYGNSLGWWWRPRRICYAWFRSSTSSSFFSWSITETVL